MHVCVCTCASVIEADRRVQRGKMEVQWRKLAFLTVPSGVGGNKALARCSRVLFEHVEILVVSGFI